MALLECAKPNLLRQLVPSKVAVEAVVLHPGQLALLRANQQKKSAHHVKNVHRAKNVKSVRLVTTMANLKATIAMIVVTATIVAIAMIAMDVTAVDVIAMIATAMVATIVAPVVEIAITI
jgi:ABC-type bacteriocin/lantibiotic exporter with double-glycine peptidase domain